MLTSTKMTFISLRGLLEGWENNQRISASQLAERYNFGERSLTVNLTKLVRAGILYSVTGGKARGYKFSQDPRTISMADILEVIEGKMEFKGCTEILDEIKCDMECCDCSVHKIISSSYNELMEKLGKLSVYEFSKQKN